MNQLLRGAVVLNASRADQHDLSHPRAFGFEFGELEQAPEQEWYLVRLLGSEFQTDQAE
jgi:hypothetical protein